MKAKEITKTINQYLTESSWPWLDQFMKGASVKPNDTLSYINSNGKHNVIEVKDVLNFIKNMSDSDKAKFKDALVKIDFKYGNSSRFLGNFAKEHNLTSKKFIQGI
jgi:hypothetical protein